MPNRIRYDIYPPKGSMDLISHTESAILKKTAKGELYPLFRNCTLAVLNTGSKTDDPHVIFNKYKDYDIELIRTERGIKLRLYNPPHEVFVDGKLTDVIRRNLFSVLRDTLFIDSVSNLYQEYKNGNGSILDNTIETRNSLTTDFVFAILRNANTLRTDQDPNIIVCWGGHSINQTEYEYGYAVGQELGVRHLNICTGCGPGAMEAPMRGAAVGHARQSNKESRFIGITETSIVAAEPPNPLVNELIVMSDIEKRLEAFIRLGHGVIIFPGGVGTAEEFFYILGLLLLPQNKDICLPLILTGPKESEQYFRTLDKFIERTLGKEAQKLYEIIIDDPVEVAKKLKLSMPHVKDCRQQRGDSYCFNWLLTIPEDFQKPFIPTHENMATLDLHLDQPKEKLAANLRKAFSGIVAGNVKEFGVNAIAEKGPFELTGDPELMEMVDELLRDFVEQQRMKLPGSEYEPCYIIKS
ncbi:nucleotide 5'-monophosphate nucleosidase PpnN [Ignatzschineria rhizosphaerae]|uniref:AMP nucleosidase n=1 Tax=Ignatzschineria rhizosphaerae TaxID=2923279 RepID=A0ABY3X2I0_9GAMM|nr:nucleotide 5'-monophosphate nucleosidase PpnN [Ignatzschineria rhizosphaerae]UNM95976.1 nucleotide 5'-monophosphate nucleosidase PpnN [Ignatzschineria rhizosphaerae]